MKTTRFYSLCTAVATLILHSCSPAPAYAGTLMPIRWAADASKDVAFATTIAQGETRELICTLKNYGVSVSIPDTATASLHYQTNGMGRVYWAGGSASVTTGGVITAAWTPALDVGASAYSFVLGVQSGTNRIYTAYGIIRMRLSPGYAPNAIAPPVRTLDFDAITVTHAPWATPADIVSATGAITPDSIGAVAADTGTMTNQLSVVSPIAGESWLAMAANGIRLYRTKTNFWDFVAVERDFLRVSNHFMDDHRYYWPTFEGWGQIALTRDIDNATNNLASSMSLLKLSEADDRVESLRIASNSISSNLVDGAFIMTGVAQFAPTGSLTWTEEFDGLGDVWSSINGNYEAYLWTSNILNSAVESFCGISLPESVDDGSWRLWIVNSGTASSLGVYVLGAETIPTDYSGISFEWVGLLTTNTTYAAAATQPWVAATRGIFTDIASNVVYHVVVSNGHWLIKEVQ